MAIPSISPSRFALLLSLCAGVIATPLSGLAADPDYNTPSSSGSSNSMGTDTPPSGNTGSTTGDSGAGTYVKDSYITAKVKAALARDRDVTARNIKVDTSEQGVVTLSGMAKNQAEADKAAADARSVEGVTSVVNNIQVR